MMLLPSAPQRLTLLDGTVLTNPVEIEVALAGFRGNITCALIDDLELGALNPDIERRAELEARIAERVRAEWPGTRMNRGDEIFIVPEVRKGGTTDSLIELAARIGAEEATR